MSQFEVLQAALKAQDVRQLLAKCETSGALTREQAAKVKARIDAAEMPGYCAIRARAREAILGGQRCLTGNL